MGRKRRIQLPDTTYHVWARGNDRQPIFVDDADRKRYLRILGDAVDEFWWRCLAYCLMPNHVHLVLWTRHANLAAGMCTAHNAYARSFNARHGKVNHLFGDRYGSSVLQDAQQVRRIVGYVANNPVAAGLCERAEDWPWGSHAAIVGGRAPGWLDVGGLTEWFGGLQRYIAFVARDVASSSDLG